MHSELNWTTDDGLKIFSQFWQPQGETKGVINLVHGLGEHSGRYETYAKKLADAGYVFFAFDLRGSGKSGGKRGHVPAYKFFLNDIHQFLQESHKRFPYKPQFLYGHSLGGNLALNYCMRRNYELQGLIVTSPWLKLALKPSLFKILLGQGVDLVWPSFSQHNGISAHALSHDPQIVESYANDPLVHNRISTRLFFEAHRAANWTLEHSQDLRIPLLLMHGTEDGITSYEGSKEFAAGVKGECTLKLWEGQYHELHNEYVKEEVFQEILGWLEIHL
ncbi:MAG: alpha/beta hydrolase [Bacillota bacterium]